MTNSASELEWSNKNSNIFDSTSLNGLRGFVSLHILLFHSIQDVTLVNIYGDPQMPLFFLLSGFCMTLGYGKKKFSHTSIGCGPCKKPINLCMKKNIEESKEENTISTFDSWNFYKSRFARILPVYYATFVYAIPLIFLGHQKYSAYNYGSSIGGSIVALFFQQTVLMTYFGYGPNQASWTISTLFFFYWFYPSLLVFAQRQCNQKLAIFVTISYYFQAILGTTLFHAILPVFDFVGAYWFSIAHPLSRIPVFFMGVCAGVICVRIQEQDFDAMNCFGQLNNNVILSFIEDVFFPIPIVISKKVSNQIIINEEQIKVKQKSWARRVNLNGGYYFLVLFTFSILNAVYTIEENISGIEVCNLVSRYPDEICNNSTMMRDFQKNGSYLTDDVWTYPKSIDYKIFKWALPSIYGHFFFCNVQLMIIVGLCLDGGDSILAKFFNTKPMQFLGRISMSIYLVHVPTIFWINCAIIGPFPMSIKPAEINLPLWAIPIHILISVILGIVLTLYIEEPARKKLNKWWKIKKM